MVSFTLHIGVRSSILHGRFREAQRLCLHHTALHRQGWRMTGVCLMLFARPLPALFTNVTPMPENECVTPTPLHSPTSSSRSSLFKVKRCPGALAQLP